jgi:MerR family mercuric resistance operon transcriptional regulator
MHPIGEAARQSGVNIETIRYYEREGLVPPPARSASGRRLYDGAAIARLRFIKRCRSLGFSIRTILTLLTAADDPGNACGDVKTIGERHLCTVRDKIADLKELERTLAGLLAECDRGKRSCSALRRLFADR